MNPEWTIRVRSETAPVSPTRQRGIALAGASVSQPRLHIPNGMNPLRIRMTPSIVRVTVDPLRLMS